jgi:hypothetical protein
MNAQWTDERNLLKHSTIEAITSVKINSCVLPKNSKNCRCLEAYKVFSTDENLLKKIISFNKYSR